MTWTLSFGGTLPLHTLTDDLAFEHVKGGEQSRDAMAFVTVGHGAGPPLLHRQHRLGAIERLNLALLINRQNDGVVRRIDIEADDVTQLGDELRVIGQLELTHPVGLQPVGPPDALHRADADPDCSGHGRAGPMGCVRRRSSQGQGCHALDNLGCQRRDSRGPRLVAPQPGNARGAKPLLPAPDHGFGLSGSPHDFGGAVAVRCQQDDLCPPDMLLRTVSVGYNRFQLDSLGSAQFDLGSCVHSRDSHDRVRRGIRKRIEMSGLIH